MVEDRLLQNCPT